MKTFGQFLADSCLTEIEDAHKHGYEFHFLENHPKGHHTVLATHPKVQSKVDDSLDHKLWLDREVFRKGTPKRFQKKVVGLATINHQTHQPYNLYVHEKHRRKGV